MLNKPIKYDTMNLHSQATLDKLNTFNDSIKAISLHSQAMLDKLSPFNDSIKAISLHSQATLDKLSPFNDFINSNILMKLENTINSFNQMISFNTGQLNIDIDTSKCLESIQNIYEYIEYESENTDMPIDYQSNIINNSSLNESNIKNINYNELISLICLVITTILSIIQHIDNSNNENLIESLDKINNTINLMIESGK